MYDVFVDKSIKKSIISYYVFQEQLTFKDSMGHRPSKVLLIESLFWKTFVGIDKLINNEKLSTFSQPVNLRNKVVPKLPHYFMWEFY